MVKIKIKKNKYSTEIMMSLKKEIQNVFNAKNIAKLVKISNDKKVISVNDLTPEEESIIIRLIQISKNSSLFILEDFIDLAQAA